MISYYPPKKFPTRLLPNNMIRSYNKLRVKRLFDWDVYCISEYREVCLPNRLNTRGFKPAGHSLDFFNL